MRLTELRQIIREEISIALTTRSLTETFSYPEGVKSTGDKILDKLAKLLHAPAATIAIRSWSVQGRNVPFFTGPETVSVTGNSSENFYTISTKHGNFRIEKAAVKKADELYSEIQSIVQLGKPQKSKQS